MFESTPFGNTEAEYPLTNISNSVFFDSMIKIPTPKLDEAIWYYDQINRNSQFKRLAEAFIEIREIINKP